MTNLYAIKVASNKVKIILQNVYDLCNVEHCRFIGGQQSFYHHKISDAKKKGRKKSNKICKHFVLKTKLYHFPYVVRKKKGFFCCFFSFAILGLKCHLYSCLHKKDF